MNYSYDEIMEYVSLYFTTGVRWVCMGLAVLILLHQIFALLKMRNPSEIWAYLKCPDGSSVPLIHWENLMGRARSCDVILNLGGVSRSHGTLIRDSAGIWEYNDLGSKNGSYINGKRVTEPTVMRGGDVLTIGGQEFELYPLSLRERLEHIERRKRSTKRTSPWLSMLAITIFQILTVIQFRVAFGDEYPAQLTAAFLLLCLLMWVYVITLRILKRTGFEVELIAFFLSTLSLAVTASAYPGSVFKQALCVMMGVLLFFAMCWFLRDLSRAKRVVFILMGISVLLLLINLVAGTSMYGAQNWIRIGDTFTIQPSELVKIVFIFVGAASLDELQQRRNLLIFMSFSFFCLICLAIMGDFGTALIFFATFLIISFLRSGDFTKLFLVLGAAALMGLMVLRFKPHVAARFEIWRHIWDDPTGDGFQQVQTVTSIASGGLPGLGAGEGNLSDVAAASTDLVFGLLAEEWGLVIAILAVLCIITLGVFAYRSIMAGRSTYYCIAVCATTSMFMFQTILNVFGSIDLLPLTGVTFPFVSSGGTSMIASWGMLAFLKAADTRQNASLAVRVNEKHPDDDDHPRFPPASVESVSAVDIYDVDELYEALEKSSGNTRGNAVPRRTASIRTAPGRTAPRSAILSALSRALPKWAASGNALRSAVSRAIPKRAVSKASSRPARSPAAPESAMPQGADAATLKRTVSQASSRQGAPRPAVPPVAPRQDTPRQAADTATLKRSVSQAPSRQDAPRPAVPSFSEPQKSTAPSPKTHPKAVKYTEISDDDFFGRFGNVLPSSDPQQDQERPVTLDDIFGEDGLFGGDKK
ncbi:MAG: FtsW/RodA/SpoVE family cell cycle protein [Bacillota bacterium]|nr:FtsW/RodA/SpoVE family cell cycle protein [Bacillota bacterium]